MFRSFKSRTRRVFEGYIVDATGAAMLVGSVGMFVEIGIKQAYASVNHQLTVHCFATYQQGRRTAPCVLQDSSYYYALRCRRMKHSHAKN